MQVVENVARPPMIKTRRETAPKGQLLNTATIGGAALVVAVPIVVFAALLLGFWLLNVWTGMAETVPVLLAQ